MNIDSIQPTLFSDPIGERFKRAREKKRLSKQLVAQQLRLPTVIIDAIENEDWLRLGAPIYVRSYVGSYARLLDLPADIANEIANDKQIPKLQPWGSSSRARHLFDRGIFNFTSFMMTAIIAGLVVMLALHFNSSKPLVLLLPLDPPMAGIETPTVSQPHVLTPALADHTAPAAVPVAKKTTRRYGNADDRGTCSVDACYLNTNQF